jgi:hypothetical protein
MKLSLAGFARLAFVALNLLGMVFWLAEVEPIDWHRGVLYECLNSGDMVVGGMMMFAVAVPTLLLNALWIVYAGVRAWYGHRAEALSAATVVLTWGVLLATIYTVIPRLPGC